MYQTKKINFFLLFALTLAARASSFASSEGMSQMPTLQPKTVHTISSKEQGEELLNTRGFGDQEPKVRMMNLMMVEGSGYVGMDMNQVKLAEAKPAPSSHAEQVTIDNSQSISIELDPNSKPPKVDSNTFNFTIKNPKTGQLLKSLKPKVDVYMTDMDMGTEHPKVKEISPGHYRLKANFSMTGPWAIKMMLPGFEKVFVIHVRQSVDQK